MVSTLQKDSLRDVVPKHGWLNDYYTIVKPTELSPRFAMLSAISMIGGLINNKVSWTRVQGLFAPIYPNPWIILVGPAGRGHKTSALGMVERLMRSLPRNKQPKILSESITPKALVHALTVPEVPGKAHLQPKDAIGTLYAPELAVFLGREHYNAGMVTLLTRLYDCPEVWSDDTISRGLLPLRNVCISVIGGTVPRWFSTRMPEEAFSGGPMSRFILVILPRDYDPRIWEPDSPEPSKLTKLRNDLEIFTELSGKITLTDEARRWIADWYEHSPSSSDEELLDAYYARKPEQMIRLAALMEICEHGAVVDVGLNALKQSLQWMDILEHELLNFLETKTFTPKTESAQRILDIMRKPQFKGKISRTSLVQKAFRYLPGKTDEFDQTIRWLEAGQYIVSKVPNTGKKGDVWYHLISGKQLQIRR